MGRFLLVALLAFAFVPTADAGPSTGRQALRIARKADARSKVALTRASAALAASRVIVRGADGTDGIAGSNGQAGAAGPAGPAGATGGPMHLATATNPSAVQLGAVFTTREETVAQVGFTASGTVLLMAEGEITEIRGQPTPVTCDLRLGAATVATREFDLAGGDRMLVSLSASPTVADGGHAARFVCWRTDGRTDAVAEFPAGRVSLTVLSG